MKQKEEEMKEERLGDELSRRDESEIRGREGRKERERKETRVQRRERKGLKGVNKEKGGGK